MFEDNYKVHMHDLLMFMAIFLQKAGQQKTFRYRSFLIFRYYDVFIIILKINSYILLLNVEPSF